MSKDRPLSLMRGALLKEVISAEEESKVTLKIELDGAQYKEDLLRVAVEDSMFVEEIYGSCQVVVK